VSQDSVQIELEAEVLNDYTWVGFGLTDPKNYAMVGSDVTITGFFSGANSTAPQAQALDYYLTAQMQCNYNTGATEGVCPDDGVSCPNSAVKGKQDATLISAERVGTIQRVRFSRPLTPTDPCDRPFTPTSKFVWATGPITQGGARLVVNTHGATIAGMRGHAPSSNANNVIDVTANIGNGACMAPPGRENAMTMDKCVPVALIKDKTTFENVTIENFADYPNKPAWGVAWHFDGVGAPEIVLRRGTKYTFKIRTAANHPFYITDNPIGGRENKNEVIYAGSANAHGANGVSIVEFTPNATTPNLLYYQCWQHLKLGWRFWVFDANAPIVLPSNTATVCPGSTTVTSGTPAVGSTTTGVTTSGGTDTQSSSLTSTSITDTTTVVGTSDITGSSSSTVTLAATIAVVVMLVAVNAI